MNMRIGGLASGMDIDSIVSDLMRAERIPLDKLTQNKIWAEWQQDAYRDINLKLSSLSKAASNLRLQSSYNSFSASSSNSSSVTAEANANALSGSYAVNVINIAREAKIHSANTIEKSDGTNAKASDQIGESGTITIKTGTTTTASISITSTMTYSDVAKAIQDKTAGKSTELRVNFDETTSRFFISTKGMGENQNFTMEFSSETLAKQVINDTDTTTNITTTTYSTNTGASFTTAATSGEIVFDGITVNGLTSNKTTINGITLNLNQPGTSTINIQSDTSKPVEMIKSFVEKYNEIIEDIEKKLVEKRYSDFPPLTDEQRKAMEEKEIELWEEKAKSGLLRGDQILQGALNDLRRAFMDPVDGIASGQINLLSQIGINTGHYSEGGKLTIDETKLKEALTKNPDEVINFFTKTNDGVGERVYKQLNDVVSRLSNKAGNPSYSVDNSTITKRIREMNEEILNFEDRLITIEDRYWRQFSAMEKAINQMNQQSSWLSSQFSGGM